VYTLFLQGHERRDHDQLRAVPPTHYGVTPARLTYWPGFTGLFLDLGGVSGGFHPHACAVRSHGSVDEVELGLVLSQRLRGQLAKLNCLIYVDPGMCDNADPGIDTTLYASLQESKLAVALLLQAAEPVLRF